MLVSLFRPCAWLSLGAILAVSPAALGDTILLASPPGTGWSGKTNPLSYTNTEASAAAPLAPVIATTSRFLRCVAIRSSLPY